MSILPARIRTLGTSTQGVMSAAVLVAASLILSRVIGLFRVSIFAALFGTSAQMADYNAAFRIPDLLFAVIAGGALSSAFVPVFAGLIERRREDEAWAIANTVLNTLLITMIVLAVAAFILAPQLVDALVPKFTAAGKAETANLTRIMLAQPVLLGVGGLFAAMQNSYGRFVLPAVAPVLYNVVIVLGALLFGPHFGVYAAAWAVTDGALIMFEIQIWGVGPESSRYRPRMEWRLAGAREVLKLLGPRLLGLSAYQVMLLVTTYLASGLGSTGFNSISYAWTLLMFPVGAIGSSLGTAVFPTLARQTAGDQRLQLRRTLRQSLRGILFLAVPATIGLILLRRPIIVVLYGHGAWTPASTAATAYALLFYSLGLAAMTLIEVIPRAFYALRNTRTPVMIAVVSLAVDIALSIILIHTFPRSQGQGGLAIATAVAVWLQAVWLMVALRPQIGGVLDREFLRAVMAIAAASLLMGVGVFVVARASDVLLRTGTGFGALVEVVVGVSIGVAIYLGVARALKLPEIERLGTMI